MTFQQRVRDAFGIHLQQIPKPYRMPLVVTTCTALIMTPFIWRRVTYIPELVPPFPKATGRYDNVRSSSATMTLPDGRKLGYAQFGDPEGKAIICLHGIPGSRLENALFDANAKELGARIIGIDRPGVGLSTPESKPLKERKVIDHAEDVEALAEHLQLKDYAIIGTSGGGPYALGCASALPSAPSKPNLKAVSVVTGLGLRDMSQAWPAPLVWLNQQIDLSWLVVLLTVRGPIWNMDLSDEERMVAYRQALDLKKVHPKDAELARRADSSDMVKLFLQSSREAFAQGREAYQEDCVILSRNPGFRIEDTRADLPVQLWCGTDDSNVSAKAGEETAQRLEVSGNKLVELHMESGHTHGSTQVNFQRQILEDVLRAME
jgi:pimeloyl-ACP methyl ester carboxylesterase